jgi:hypothetical protein
MSLFLCNSPRIILSTFLFLRVCQVPNIS